MEITEWSVERGRGIPVQPLRDTGRPPVRLDAALDAIEAVIVGMLREDLGVEPARGQEGERDGAIADLHGAREPADEIGLASPAASEDVVVEHLGE